MKRLSSVVVSLLGAMALFVSPGRAQVDYAAPESYIERAVRDFEIAGLAIALVKDGEVGFSRAYGFKNPEKIDLPNPDFHFFNLDFKRVRK